MEKAALSNGYIIQEAEMKKRFLIKAEKYEAGKYSLQQKWSTHRNVLSYKHKLNTYMPIHTEVTVRN
jgi:hypothetical protein